MNLKFVHYFERRKGQTVHCFHTFEATMANYYNIVLILIMQNPRGHE